MALILAVALVFALAGCAATSLDLDKLYDDVMALQVSVNEYAASVTGDDTYIEVEEEVELEVLTEYELMPFARFSNLYVTEGSEIADYLAYVTVIDEEVVTAIEADASAVDLSTAGDYDLVYTVTVNKDMYDAYIAAQEYLTVTKADEGVDNVEHLGLVNGNGYTIEVKYLVGTEDEDTIPSLLRDEDGNIVKTETTFTVEGDSGELQIEHDTSIYPEDKVVTPVYFLLSGDTVEAEEVIVTKTVHVYTEEEYTAEVDAGTITESEDGVATSAETEVVTPAPTATAKPASTATPTATATPKPSTSGTTTTATATPAPTATAKLSTTTATATPTPTATAKPSTGGTTTTTTATPKPTTSSGSTTTTHTHSYTSTVTTAATCTTAGVRTYTCSCGDSYTETIAATGHNWVTVSDGYYTTVVDVAAYDEYIAGYWYCPVCGAKFSSSEEASDHSVIYAHNGYTRIYSETIHHDAETHQEWIDTSYQQCTNCGATQ